MIKVVIFDMDGVVADTHIINSIADFNVLKAVGVAKTAKIEKIYVKFAGLPERQIYNMIISGNKIDADVNSMLQRREAEIERALASKGLKPSNGFNELAKKLKAKGYKVALASSSSRRKIDNVLSALKLENTFSLIVSANDVEMNKPAPDIYLEAARRLNLGPEECVAVEDSETGVTSAKSAGLKCIALRTRQTAEHNLSAADMTVESLKGINVDGLDRI